MEEFGYEKLDVWKESMNLVDQIYLVTTGFPKSEMFGLTSQMRRAAVSAPSKIAEGYGKSGKSFANHIQHSIGSLFELRTQIEIARRQNLISAETETTLRTMAVQICRKLESLKRTVIAKS